MKVRVGKGYRDFVTDTITVHINSQVTLATHRETTSEIGEFKVDQGTSNFSG